ncbi:bifunctional lytic transglycosylase/C40 family peptidase [Planotetraspora sp. A-T 1434]|uniref:C40 family peptidase n=1 Tax=Planotetraspora sp. A-T 1434 TaxID=2979219 RepID=UPI0021BEA163|nr:bifunctional lytic transglycosylase/C40 family peptidase [Planotetraspora sp. A-T 1434]MCT9932662.1 bifunctional lytic transglycosylase/C40 family peptidase [Planotetraspora sp. A-T 1434]
MTAPPRTPFRGLWGRVAARSLSWRGIAVALAFIVPMTLFGSIILMTPSPSIILGGRSGEDCAEAATAVDLSETARSDIPSEYLQLYKKFGQKIGVQWNVLAAIGKRETDHGRSKLPGVQSGTNYAGAAGPMQFLVSTWGGKAKIKIGSGVNGYASDGDGDGYGDIYNPADAILGAAKMLKRNGAPDDLRRAIFVYNRATWYVDQVLEIAKRYDATGDIGVPAEADPNCDSSYVATASSEVVRKILEYALAQRGKPYRWGGTGPDAFDCSGIIYMAYRNAGLTIPRTTFGQWPFGEPVQEGSELPGDLVFFNAGPGTSADHPGHVGLVVSPGKMVEARCTLCGPIKVTTYKDRPNIVGFTRPLENADVVEQLKRALT